MQSDCSVAQQRLRRAFVVEDYNLSQLFAINLKLLQWSKLQSLWKTAVKCSNLHTILTIIDCSLLHTYYNKIHSMIATAIIFTTVYCNILQFSFTRVIRSQMISIYWGPSRLRLWTPICAARWWLSGLETINSIPDDSQCCF